MIKSKPMDPTQPDRSFLPIRPYGLFVEVDSEENEPPAELEAIGHMMPIAPDEYLYKGTVHGIVAGGEYRTSPIEFSLPIVDDRGFFRVGNTLYRICNVGLVDPFDPLNVSGYNFFSWKELIPKIIKHIFGYRLPPIPFHKEEPIPSCVFANFFFNSKENTSHVNSFKLSGTLNSRIITHPYVMQIADNKREIESFEETVLLFPRKLKDLSIDNVTFKEWMINRLDPSSTSSSGKINVTFQLADGAIIENGKITPGHSKFCRFTNRNAVAIDLTPKRAHHARSAITNSAELVNAEERPVHNKNSCLQSINFRTVIMDLGIDTFEDTIAISRSAASKFTAITRQTISRWSKRPLNDLKAFVGSKVEPKAILASQKEIDSNNPEFSTQYNFTADELKEESVIDNITVTTQWKSGELGYKTTWHFYTELPLRDGDKITCLSGYKGVVSILPDEDMPMLVNGDTADICISPKSVAERGVVSMYIEMAMGRAFKDGKFKQLNDFPADKLPLSLSTVSVTYGRKDTFLYHGFPLPYKSYWGYIPWIRLVKSGISSRRVSAVGEDRPLTSEDLIPNNASIGGQKLDSSKGIILLLMGMNESLDAILGSSSGIDYAMELIASLEGPSNEFRIKHS